jgi:hypothetical protein
MTLPVCGPPQLDLAETCCDFYSLSPSLRYCADKSKSKLDVAKEVLQGMLDKLRPDDSGE